MNALVIAQRYLPVDSDPKMELRLAVDPNNATLNVVAIRDERVALVDLLSEPLCRRRQVLPPEIEAIRRDTKRLLTSIPDSDYVRLVMDDPSDVLEQIVRLRVSEPPASYYLVPAPPPKAPNRDAPPLDSIHLTLEERPPDTPDQPSSMRSARHSEGLIRLAAFELRGLRQRTKLRGTAMNSEVLMRLAIKALKRAGDMLDSCYSTIYLGE